MFRFREMYDLYICTYLLTYSYVDLLFLRLLMVWKFMTSNESVNVLKVEARYQTLLIKYVCKIETDYLEIFAKCWKSVRFLVKYKAKDKRGLNDWFPEKK